MKIFLERINMYNERKFWNIQNLKRIKKIREKNINEIEEITFKEKKVRREKF